MRHRARGIAVLDVGEGQEDTRHGERVHGVAVAEQTNLEVIHATRVVVGPAELEGLSSESIATTTATAASGVKKTDLGALSDDLVVHIEVGSVARVGASPLTVDDGINSNNATGGANGILEGNIEDLGG